MKWERPVRLYGCGERFDDLRREFPDVPILGIIEGASEKSVKIAEITGNKKIGVIGTQATISCGSFEQCIRRLDDSCEVYSQACPLFVPLVENGHVKTGDMITKLAAEKYLQELSKLKISSLILGCTHYPLIEKIIGEVIETELIDAGAEAAYRLQQEMHDNNLLNVDGTGSLEIFVSDEGMNFAEIASSFLGFDVKPGIHGMDSGIFRTDIAKY